MPLAPPGKSRIERLRSLSQPQYRLRVGDIRVFYDVTEAQVEALAIVSAVLFSLDGDAIQKLPANAVVLNWSNRARWPKFSVPVMLFRCFAGEREFKPIGLVFERFDTVARYRFWQPFRDAKHGRPGALEHDETTFLGHAVTWHN